MQKNMKNREGTLHHPYTPYIPKNATKLVIGSFPPSRFCFQKGELNEKDVRFYYGSYKNHFWKLLDEATGEKLTFDNTEASVQERKDLLDKLEIGITDLIEICIREGGKSDDKSLQVIKYKPIAKLLAKHSKIDTLICTSTFVKEKLRQITHGKYRPITKRSGTMEIDNKTYNIIILYSPSPRALMGMGPMGAKKRMDQYMSVFQKNRY